MDTKFFAYPFASGGDKTAVPNPAPGGGEVSYVSGYGPDYQLEPGGDPDALRIERNKFNQIIFDITSNLRQYQLQGFPQWALAAQNEGAAVVYPKGARVVWNGGAGTNWVVYTALIVGATAEPGTDPTEWGVDASAATIALLKANNLSDLTNVPNARAALGLGSAALFSASTFATAGAPSFTGILSLNGVIRETAKDVAALDIDWANTDYPRKAIAVNSVITFSNFPGANVAQTINLKLTLSAGAVPTFTPGGGVTIQWVGDFEPEWEDGVWLVGMTTHGDSVARIAAGFFAG